MTPSPIAIAKDGVRVAVRLTPKASRDRVVGIAAEADGGELIVGGERVLADEAPDAFYVQPAIVRMPGALAGRFTLHRRHRALREEVRSILVDRPATGRSDTGPFPLTTLGEIGELLAAIDAAPENGPFALVGYSCGTGNGAVS